MMAEGQQKSHARVAFALVCGLALCCAVMYVTADGAETVHAEIVIDDGNSAKYTYKNILHKDLHSVMAANTDLAAVKGLRAANTAVATGTGHEEKVESWDVKKVGTIITDDTPDGRLKLIDYFKKVERQIAAEVSSRKTDIASIRTQMAKNREYNAKARATMKKALLAKMAVNAKKAKDDLHKQMRITAKKFHEQHTLENKRWKATLKRSKKTREIMRKNKKEYNHNLHMAVLNQQRALAALDASTNAKIKKTNEDIAANAAQIKANAIKARKDLDHANDAFDKKMFNIGKEAQAGRSRLVALSKSMDKKVRAMITLKMKKATAWAAKEFQDVRTTMAKNRKQADQALAAESTRLKAALASAKALQDKRFKQTVADIKKTREEADAAIKKMTQGFKMSIYQLTSVVKHSVAKLNSRVTTLSGVITSNKLEQAKVNSAVDKEIKNMIAIGNKREDKLAKKDVALKAVMAANKEDTEKKMETMAKDFYLQLSKIRAQMKKDRAFQSRTLGKATSELFNTLKKNVEEQDKINKKLTEATHQARIDADNALREAKHGFANRLGALHTVVVANDKKANKKIAKLTGVVAANAAKDAHGRMMLKMQSKANKLELKNAIRDAVQKGEKRARQVEAMAKKMNKKTQDALNHRITTEIGTLSKKIHSDIETLKLQSKEARSQMKEEVLTSLREEQSLLKEQLSKVIAWANKKFQVLDENLETEKTTSAAGRAALKADIAAEEKKAKDAISYAVAAQAKGLLALKAETQRKIKKTNKDVAAYGEQIAKHAKDVTATMKANIKILETKLKKAKMGFSAELKKADAASVARHVAAIKQIEDGLANADKVNTKKFGDVFEKMGADRVHADQALAAAVKQLNDGLSKHAALEDRRFATTVKDLAKARKDTWEDVKEARKFFTMGFALATSELKKSEGRIQEAIEDVADLVEGDKVIQARVNEQVDKELKLILKLSNDNHAEAKRARGKIGELMNKNKVVAHQEIADLAKSTKADIKATRSYMAKLRAESAKDLTSATEKLYLKLNQDSQAQQAELAKMTSTLTTVKASTAAALKKATEEFEDKYITLVDNEAANHKKYEEGLQKVTGVAHDWKVAAAKDRELMKIEAKIMNNDLNKAIARAVAIGEAKAKEVLEHSTSNVDAVQRALSQEIAEQVEAMSDNVLKTLHSSRKAIAQNFLSVKGYTAAAKGAISDMIEKGGLSKNSLSSIGDFLYAVSEGSTVKTKPAEGVAAGAGFLTATFSGDIVPEVSEINKVNGLVDEYMEIYTSVSMRWPYGLGNYLLKKLSHALTKEGVLTIGSKDGSEGQWVYLSGKAIGLSSKMGELEAVGARVTHYQEALAKLSAKLPKKAIVKPLVVPPPEWQGN
jgi:hypothetical protein